MASLRELFIQKIAPYAQDASKRLGIPASVIIAQLGIESADGTSNPAKGYNNYGGIMENPHMDFRGKKSTQGTYFAGYNSIASFFNDYVRVLSMNNYGYDKVRSAGSVEDTVKALAASGYDAGHYGGTGASILNYINQNGLRKYDAGGGTSTPIINPSELRLIDGVPGVVIAIGTAAAALAALMRK